MAGGSGESDLNLVPYMDIMVNLIMFMLVVTAYIVELREAPVIAPSYGGSDGGGAQEKPKPHLTVAITSRGFGILSSSAEEVPGNEIARSSDQYAYRELTAMLRDYKNRYELMDTLNITPDASVPYAVLVSTMDAARSDASGPLFPDVTLGLAVGSR
jgi:biopolymer transport protein ExbD